MSSTADYLQAHRCFDLAFLLVLEGVNLAFTTSEDFAGIEAALDAATGGEWDRVLGGLEYPGEIVGKLDPFKPKVNVEETLDVSIVDYDDTLIQAVFREGDDTVPQTELADDVDSDDTTIPLEDATEFPSSGPAWIGNEEMTYDAKAGESLTGATRGLRRLFYTAVGDPYRFGVPHVVERDSGAFAPRVTSSVAQTWLNRGAALFLLHRLPDGSWSAPFATDAAHLLFAGRIKNWQELNGRVTFQLRTILERTQTTLLSEQFRGTLAEGIWLTTDAAQFQVKAVHWPGAGGLNRYESGYVTLSGVDAYRTHDQIADAINEALAVMFNATPGTPFPSTARMDLKLVGSDVGATYQFHWRNSAASSADHWIVQVWLSPQVFQFLGFGRGSGFSKTPDGFWVDSRELAREKSTEVMTLQAAEAPQSHAVRTEGQAIGVGVRMSVTAARGVAYQPQTFDSIPWPMRVGEPTGFLKVGGKHIVPVKVDSVSGDVTTFVVTGKPINAYLNRAGYDSEAIYAFQDALTLADQGGDPVPVEQVWCEAGALGAVMLRILCSTGTEFYNHPFWDTLPRGMGCGIPWTLLDSDSILAMGKGPYLLFVTKPTPFLELFESALKFCNRHVVWRNGKLSVVAVGEEWSGATSLIALTEDNKATQLSSAGDVVSDRSVVERDQGSIINRVTLEYHHLLDGKPGRTLTLKSAASRSDFEQERAEVIKAFGIYDTGGLVQADGAAEWARETGATLLAYLSRPLAYVNRSIDFDVGSRLYPGARVAITDPAIVNPVTGTRGVVGLLAWCVSVSMNWRTGVGRGSFAFSPELSWLRLAGYGPSVRVDETANTGGFTNGYDAATKRLKCKAHEYSESTAPKDLRQLAAGDKVKIVRLSQDPLNVYPVAQPVAEWSDTINATDSSSDYVTLTTGLSGFPSSGGYYVIIADDVSTVTSAQRTVRAFLAEASTLTTGYATRDAVRWGGGKETAGDPTDADFDQPYRRRDRTADEQGEPLSTHVMHDALAWGNAALGRASRPTVLSQIFKTGPTTGSLTYQLLHGPTWIPLYGSTRPLDIVIEARVFRNSGGPAADADGKVRVSLSRFLPAGGDTGQPWDSVRYLDGPAASVELTVDNASSSLQTLTGSVSPVPGGLPSAGLPGLWLTLDGKVLDTDDRVTIRSISIFEQEWA